MTEHRSLVFVEVRYRKNSTYGSTEESIIAKKRQLLIAAAKLLSQ
jgi:Holliday junction resolvase-like predicted endonuclease